MTDPMARILALLEEVNKTLAELTYTPPILLGPNPLLPQTNTNDNRPKLSKREVTTIREMKRAGHTQAYIADAFDVNPATISRTVRGQYHRSAA